MHHLLPARTKSRKARKRSVQTLVEVGLVGLGLGLDPGLSTIPEPSRASENARNARSPVALTPKKRRPLEAISWPGRSTERRRPSRAPPALRRLVRPQSASPSLTRFRFSLFFLRDFPPSSLKYESARESGTEGSSHYKDYYGLLLLYLTSSSDLFLKSLSSTRK